MKKKIILAIFYVLTVEIVALCGLLLLISGKIEIKADPYFKIVITDKASK